MFSFENFLFCPPHPHRPVYQTQGVQCVFLKPSGGMGAALERGRPTRGNLWENWLFLSQKLSSASIFSTRGGTVDPPQRFHCWRCPAWACTGAMHDVTVAVCVTALLCIENTVSCLKLYPLSVPTFMNIPEPFSEGCSMHFLSRAVHFTASYSCTLTDLLRFCVSHHPYKRHR